MQAEAVDCAAAGGGGALGASGSAVPRPAWGAAGRSADPLTR